MKAYTKGIIIGILSIIFVSTYSVFGKILLENFSPEILATIAQALSVLVIFFFFGFFPELKKIHKLPPKDLFWLLILSILAAVIAPLFLFKGLGETQVINSVMIGRLEPVFAGIIAFLWLKESFTKYQILGILFMFLGIFIVITKGFISEVILNRGDIFIVISSLSWAIATTIFKKKLSHLLPELVVLIRNLVGAIVLFFIIHFVFNTQSDINIPLDASVLIPLGIFSLFTIVLAQIFWYKSLELIPASLASSFGLIGPFVGVSLAIVLLGESFQSHHFIGGLFVIFGLLFTIIHRQKHPKYHILSKIKHWVY